MRCQIKGEKNWMKKPLISIVIPAYNAEKYIAETLDSVMHQTYRNFEVILVNDNSTDCTEEMMNEYAKKDDRIQIYRNDKNGGVAYSRNLGVSKAKGDWIAFLDSDDRWREDKLQKQVDLLLKEDGKPIILYTASSFVDENNEMSDYVLEVPLMIGYKELLKQNVISCSSVLIKKEVVESMKMEKDEVHEDFLLWLKVLKTYQACAYGINEPLLIYRISKNSKSGNKIKAAQMTYRVYQYMGLNLIQRFYYMCHYIIRSLKKYRNIKKSRE